MKKGLKITLIVVGVIALLFVLDIGSIFLMKKPIFAIHNNGDSLDRTYYGLFYNTYNCWEYPAPQIKAKWTKFSCSENVNTTLIYGKITEINDNYIVITALKSNSSIKINDEAHISLANNPTINGTNNLIVGQYIQVKPESINESYPIMITTDKIDVISKVGNKELTSYAYEIETIETKNCDNRAKLYYNDNDRKIYTYCLDEINIKTEGKSYKLSEYLSNHNKLIDEIIGSMTLISGLNDGGTNIYRDGGSLGFTNNGLTIIKCKTLDGNRDIYIGPESLEFKENFCNNKSSTFTRTYEVKSVEEYKEQQYEDGTPVSYGKSLKVTLSQFQAETKTIILNNYWGELEKGKTYEFEFYLEYFDSIDDNIESIFKNTTLVSVKETNKKGLDQLQEKIQ